MALPPLWLSSHGPRAAPAPQLLQPFLLPKTFYPQGSADPCPLPGQEQPLPTGWAPPGAGAPQAPPAGLQRAPCGCFFDPRVFHIQWTRTKQPLLATATLSPGPAPLPGAALWVPGGRGTPPAWAAPGNPQGQPQQLALPNHQARAVAPGGSIPSLQHTEGQSAWLNISGTATAAGTSLGSSVPPIPFAAPHNPLDTGDLAVDLAVSDEVLLAEALRLFGCSLDLVELGQDGPGSGPRPGDPGGTSAAVPHRDFASLSLPQQLLTPDYSIPETSDAILSLEEFNPIGMELQELWGDVGGKDLPPSQPATTKQQGKKRGKRTLPQPPSKHRVLTARIGPTAGAR